MMNPKVGIVILNYKKYKETELCIESLLQQKAVDMSVVIIDNGSKNESVEYLQCQYKKNKKIKIIELPKNMGYAKGNNVGIKYLRKQKIDYICVANSDIIFSTPYILKQMVDGYKEKVGIVLPMIKNPDGSYDQRVSYKKKFILLRIAKAIVERQPFFALREKKCMKQGANDNLKQELLPRIQVDAYTVTGSIFMLTPDFFKYYNQLFPETFLYFEEWATILYLHKAKLLSNLVDTDIVVHKGGGSTPENMKSQSKDKKIMAAESGRKIMKLLFMSTNKIGQKYNFKE